MNTSIEDGIMGATHGEMKTRDVRGEGKGERSGWRRALSRRILPLLLAGFTGLFLTGGKGSPKLPSDGALGGEVARLEEEIAALDAEKRRLAEETLDEEERQQRLRVLENRILLLKEKIALRNLEAENRNLENRLATYRSASAERKIEEATKLSTFLQQIAEDPEQARGIEARIDRIVAQQSRLDAERAGIREAFDETAQERAALAKRIGDLEQVLQKAQTEGQHQFQMPLLDLLRRRLVLLDRRLALFEALLRGMEEEAAFFRQVIATLSGYRKAEETRITGKTIEEVFQAVAHLPRFVAREGKVFGEICMRRGIEFSKPGNRGALYLATTLFLAGVILFIGIRRWLSRRVPEELSKIFPQRIARILTKIVDAINRSLLGFTLLGMGYLLLRIFRIPEKYRLLVLTLLSTPVALQFLLSLGPPLIREFAPQQMQRALIGWLFVIGLFLACVVPAGVLLDLYDVGETLRFAHRYVTYFGILLILIFILVHKGKEIQERFKVPNPSLIARLYNGIIQFLFWCLLAFLLVVLALFLGNEIIEATELLSSFLQTIVLLFLSISLVRFFDRFRPTGKAEQSPFSLALDRKFLRTVGMTYLVNALQFSIALAMLFLSLSIWGIESRQIVSLITSDTVRNVFWRLVKTVMILFGSVFFVRWTTRFIDLLFFSPDISWSAFSLRRRTTFGPLLKSVIRYITYTVAGFLALSTLGVNPKGLLAGISVVGIAIGFGAQTLVRDIITGFFLVLEDSIAVGDVVEAVGITGTVEEIGIRVTHIREFNGKLHVIPNGEISRLGNFNREWMRAIVEVSVAYEADIDKAFLALQEIGEAFCATHPDIVLDPPKVQGPIALGPSEVILRLVIKVKAMEHWEAERQLRRRIKQVFDQRGIEIPFPRRVIYHKYPPTQEHPAPPPHREEGIDYGSPTPGSSSRNA